MGLFGAIFLVTSSSGGPSSPITTLSGAHQTLGEGSAYAWIQMDEQKHLVGIGINITEEAIMTLPTEEPFYALSLQLPSGAINSPFDHAMLEWNPQGHEPPGIYDIAHFDAHFYVIPEIERMMIGPEDPEHDIEPDHSNLPGGYVKIPGGVPAMGAHWYDPTSPEFTGGTFSETMIFGSYDGELIFVEPMFTLAFLETQPKLTKPIPMPDEFESAWNIFPSLYSIKYDAAAGEYTISLHGFEEHSH